MHIHNYDTLKQDRGQGIAKLGYWFFIQKKSLTKSCKNDRDKRR